MRAVQRQHTGKRDVSVCRCCLLVWSLGTEVKEVGLRHISCLGVRAVLFFGVLLQAGTARRVGRGHFLVPGFLAVSVSSG